jgi:hypothetical protein
MTIKKGDLVKVNTKGDDSFNSFFEDKIGKVITIYASINFKYLIGFGEFHEQFSEDEVSEISPLEKII